MDLSRRRRNLAILSTISAAVAMLLLWTIPAKAARSPICCYQLAVSVSLFNLAALFAYFAFGGLAGGVAVFLLTLAVLIHLIKADIAGHYLFLVPFLMTAAAGHFVVRQRNSLLQGHNIKSEKLEEGINILTTGMGEKKASIESLEEKLRRYSLLREVTESLSDILSREELGPVIVEKAADTIGKKARALLFLVDPDKQELMLCASKDAPRVDAKKGDAFDQWVLRHRKSLFVEDTIRDFRFPSAEAQTHRSIFRSIIAAPLVSEHKILGILRMDSPLDTAFSQDDLRLLDIISDLAAVAVQNSLLYSKTQELALRDSLTGLFVRRYFMERLQEEIGRSAIKKARVSLLMLDIDHFKDYNDRYGHMAGDIVLKSLAKTIAGSLGEGEIAARYGGEEIAILLPGSDRKAARAKAEALRKTIAAKPVILRRHETFTTISAGVASYPEDALTREELIRVADERLYKAKAGGRNKVSS